MFKLKANSLYTLLTNRVNQQQENKPRLKKRHWFLGSLVVLTGSWITHSTTATVYDEFNNRQALAFALATPNNGYALNGGLPTEIFIEPLRIIHGPMTESNELAQSPASYVDEALASPSVYSGDLDESTYKIKSGDTLGSIFKKQNLDSSLPYLISQDEIGKQLVQLSVGKVITFRSNQEQQLKQIIYPSNPLQQLIVRLDKGQVIDAEIRDLAFQTREKSISGEITSSLYETAIEAGLSINLVMEMVRIFGWDIDFVLDIRQGDSFHVIYNEYHLYGKTLSDGHIIAAEFTTQNQTYRAIRFEDGEENFSYFNPQGKSMLGTFLRSPVEFSRISSRFGRRKHPILKTWRAHKGVDYAASRGTPIRATADGKVILAGKKGGYGNAIVLRHAGRFSTLYGHMNGFAKGIRSGKRVKQGDVIGYIGSTGLATGPHLHYEFRLDGVHRNPLTFKTPKASAVSEGRRVEFDHMTSQLSTQLNTIKRNYQLATNNQPLTQTSSEETL